MAGTDCIGIVPGIVCSYSTNRLADVTWGQRAVETGMSAGELRIAGNAAMVSFFVRSRSGWCTCLRSRSNRSMRSHPGCSQVTVMNLAFSVTTAWLRTGIEGSTNDFLIKTISKGIMCVAGYQVSPCPAACRWLPPRIGLRVMRVHRTHQLGMKTFAGINLAQPWHVCGARR